MTLTERPALGADAALAAALLAVDPAGLGGLHLCAGAGPERDAWLALLRRLMPAGSPWQRVPLHAGESALLGGLDLAATLQAARPVLQPGLLARADGGTLLLGSAERTPALVASLLASVLDHGEIRLQRDGLSQRQPTRWLLVALDETVLESDSPEDALPAALSERLALHLDLRSTRPGPPGEAPPADAAADWTHADVAAARLRLPGVELPDDCLQALCATALVWGVASLRAPLMAVRVARAAAALDGSRTVTQTHAEIAARLVLAHPVVANPLAAMEAARRAPTTAEVKHLARLCLDDDRNAVAAMIAGLQAEGLSLESIFIDLVAPAARLLGTMWENDQIGFDQVTMGLVLMHEIVHGMGYEYQDGPQQAGAVQRVMLASAPGSQHVLGLSIVSEFFRKGGWQVVMEISPSARELRRAVQNEWFDLIGLSIALETQLADLPALVVGLKKASRNPQVRVLLGGRVFHDQAVDPRRFGADGICTDAKEATAVASAMVAA